ncbi:MAG: Methyltransferase [Desulfotomaculum sp. 46_296]|nr:MAG: Methyltransferase [Desulfotomaculum sp. 46_296]HAU31677.1 16S rRNA (guanine(966)-N(2))-methyltransferase RsmD [Desulfotomaculum sp.]
MVRVISGIYRGRLLKVPRGWKGRPTGDRVKEALFDILGGRVQESRFLDLYAGTGNVGIEAISRGARQVCFVDQNSKAVQAIYENLRFLPGDLSAQIYVIKLNVLKALKLMANRKELYNIIFLDPPYEQRLEKPTIEMISSCGLLLPDGVIIVESSKREVLPARVDDLTLTRQQRYGDTLLTFYSFQTRTGR